MPKQVRLRYQTLEFGDTDIHLRSLRDRQQFNDIDQQAERAGVPPASWPLFGVLWDSGQVLAHTVHAMDVDGLRILEVGCGLALASLVLNQRQADITATDYNPEAQAFLAENVRLNAAPAIPFVCTAWHSPPAGLGLFDLIIGSDLLYEPAHVEQLAAFIDQHSAVAGKVLLVDPGRFLHARFSKKMVALGFTHSQYRPVATDYLSAPFKGRVLSYSRGDS